MDLEVKLEGHDATERTLYSLQDWIKQERISGLSARRKSIPPKADEMGADPVTILSVVLASAAVVELVKSIHVWIKNTRPKVKVKIQLTESKFIEIEAENLSADPQDLIDETLEKLKEIEG